MFSIVIPLFNKGTLIKRSIDSVLSQSFQDFEIIVIDDGSNDDSANYVKEYKDPRIKYFSKMNGGVSSARNYGIEKASYDWIVFLDADDELLSNALKTFWEMIEMYPLAKYFVGKNVWVKDGQSKDASVEYALKNTKKIVNTNNPHFHVWLRNFYSAPRNTAIHSSLLANANGFDERMSFFEDYDFSLRLLEQGCVVYTNEPVAVYFQDGCGLSGSSHPIEKEMAYYIPVKVVSASFWHKALLYENLEMEILWWQQHGNEEHVKLYQDMQKNYFSRVYLLLHWLRQKMIRGGLI